MSNAQSLETISGQYPNEILSLRTPYLQDFTNRCGRVDGKEYEVFTFVDVVQILNDRNLTLQEINHIYIESKWDIDDTFEIWAGDHSEKIASARSVNTIFTIDFSEIYGKGHSEFAIRLANKTNTAGLVYFVIYVHTANGIITLNSPYNYCLPLMNIVNKSERIYNMGTNGCQYYVWSSLKLSQICTSFNVQPLGVIDVKIKFRGTKNQPYEVWANHGAVNIGQFTSEDGVYTVPYSKILQQGYNDFSITSSNYYDVFEKNVVIEVKTKEIVFPSGQSVPYGDRPEVQCFDIKFPNKEMPAGGFPLLVTIHGGDWVNILDEEVTSDNDKLNKKYYEYMANDILSKGIVFVGLSYRGINNGACCEDMLNDIHDAILKILSDYGAYIDKTRIGLLGWSAGGHLALLYAYTKNTKETPIKTVISEAGPVTMFDAYYYVNNVVENTTTREYLVSVLTGLCNKKLSDLTEDDIKAISPWSCVNSESSVNIYLFYGTDTEMDQFNTIYNQQVYGDGVVPINPVQEMANGCNKCTLKTYSEFLHNNFDLYYISNSKNYRIDVLNAINDLLS